MSQVTKRALEQSLKNLLLKKPLTKITINDIAEDCGINLLTSLYFSCMEEVNRVWNEITRPEPSQLEAGLAEERGT